MAVFIRRCTISAICVGAEKGGVYSGSRDSRVTKVGKFIRAISIDELPQLVNVLKGDMALISFHSPLTCHPWKQEEYTKGQKKMFNVRPGIPGRAQVNGRKTVEWHHGTINVDNSYIDEVRNCDWIAVVSDICHNMLEDTFPSLKENLVTIPNMLAPLLIRQRADEFTPNYKQKGLHVVSVGRLVKENDNAIAAAVALKNPVFRFNGT